MSDAKTDAIKDKFSEGTYIGYTLEDMEAEWAHLSKPDDRFGSPGKFKVDLIIKDPTLAKEMETIGYNIKKKDDGRPYVTATRKAELGPPTVLGEDGLPFTGSIGNGTIFKKVHVKSKYINVAGKTWLPVYLDKIEIGDLVVYEASESLF